jgi:hypothetical protein
MSQRETANDYDHVVGMIGPELRLIEDITGIQWIVQTPHGDRWKNYWHCRTRAGLEVRYPCPLVSSLPERKPSVVLTELSE